MEKKNVKNTAENKAESEALSQTIQKETDKTDEKHEEHEMEAKQAGKAIIGADINARVAQQDAQGDTQEEEQVQTSAFLDELMSDGRKIAALLGAILFFSGCYLSFWGVMSDEGRLSQGSLFAGYMCDGLFGKLCFVLVLCAGISICIRRNQIAWYMQLGSVAAMLVQIVLIIGFGANVTEAAGAHVYPGLGSLICVLGEGIMVIFIRRLNTNK